MWAYNKYYDAAKPTILLNSHHDTVKPNPAYTRDPFSPDIEGDKLYGLGSNDAGASGVSLLATFLHYYDRPDLKYNLCVAITAEEENSGSGGLESIIPDLGPLEFAIVGEPTLMQLAIAERGLMVIDCTAHGKAGHAAREEGDNAIYKALPDMVPDLPFPQGVGSVWSGQDDRHHYLGRFTTQRRTGRVSFYGGYSGDRPLY